LDLSLSTLYSRLEMRIHTTASGNRKVIEFKRFGIENVAFGGD